MDELIQILEKIVDVLTTQARDADQWVTVKPNGPDNPGRPVLLGEGGEVKAGMGGKFNGKKLSEIPRTGKGGSAARSEEVKARGGIGSKASPKQTESPTIKAPELDKDLIRRSDDGSGFFDRGQAIQNSYNNRVKIINSLNISSAEKEKAISALHVIAMKQLQTTADSPSVIATGPARFNKTAMEKAGDKVARLGAQANSIIKSAKQTSSNNSVAERHAG